MNNILYYCALKKIPYRMEKEMNTLSFCIFDDLEPDYGPVHVNFCGNSFDDIKDHVSALVEVFRKKNNKGYSHYSGFFNDEFFDDDDGINKITHDLKDHGYYRYNRYNKYYVIAFALNYVRFEIFSKDCDKKLIKWRNNDKNDPIKGIIHNENYNENPVITFMKMLRRT